MSVYRLPPESTEPAHSHDPLRRGPQRLHGALPEASQDEEIRSCRYTFYQNSFMLRRRDRVDYMESLRLCASTEQ